MPINGIEWQEFFDEFQSDLKGDFTGRIEDLYKHSKNLIVDNIELFLNYCLRFYDRQFITRDDVSRGVVEKFENLLNEYYKTGEPQTIGIPSVAYYCASEFNLSAGLKRKNKDKDERCSQRNK